MPTIDELLDELGGTKSLVSWISNMVIIGFTSNGVIFIRKHSELIRATKSFLSCPLAYPMLLHHFKQQ